MVVFARPWADPYEGISLFLKAFQAQWAQPLPGEAVEHDSQG